MSMRIPFFALAFAALLLATTGCETVEDVSEFIDSISDGAPCESNAECLGGRCLTGEMGYPNGYCTTLNCADNGCSGFSSECFRTELADKDVTACFELCGFDGTCERADEGYTCVDLDGSAVCMPPGATSAPPQGSTGSGCSNNLQCNGDGAACLSSFFGGYCSQLKCNGDVDCLGGNPCLPLNPDAMTDADKRYACLLACESDDDCRFGYSCQDYEGSKVCLEGEGSGARNPDGKDDGAACVAQVNCKGGTCIREAEDESTGDTSFPGGYCTTRDCDDDSDCNGDSICVARSRSTACFAQCESDADCRDGYACDDVQEGKICDSIVEYIPPDPSTESTFDVTCQSSKSISFTIPDGAIGFYIAPFTKGGEKIIPKTLEQPGGTTLDIPGEYAFHAVNPEILGSLAPIMFPASDDSKFADAFGPGDYTMTVETSASEACYYVIPQTEAGTTLEMNLYFVGVPGVTESSAPDDPDVADVIKVVKAIYQSMGIDARVANYFEAEQSVSDRYSIIRDFNDVFNLVATSEAPGSTSDENLSVNVFLIQDFNISEAPGLLGVSTGIPGMAGLHGNSGSGLVFSSASLGADNGQLGQTMAHEIGHFVGLRHTTEHLGSTHDPITDTPECLAPDLAFLCPDVDNFMFAFSTGDKQRKTTDGQAFVIRRNPLVK